MELTSEGFWLRFCRSQPGGNEHKTFSKNISISANHLYNTHGSQVVKSAAAAGAQQVVVSDANSVFIPELLAAHGLQARAP